MPAAQWNALSPAQQEKFAHVCPPFMVELRSETDSLRVLLDKMEKYRANGTALG